MNLISKIFLPITIPIQFIQRNFKTVFFLTILFYILSNTDTKNLEQPNLQQIDLVGAIMSADLILEKIEKAKLDNSIKGVLLNVNSPGGAVAPSVDVQMTTMMITDFVLAKPLETIERFHCYES